MEATFLLTLLITFLASFIGYELISKIPQTLHTPLMSGSNAISGITLIAAILIYPEIGESQLLKIIVLTFAQIPGKKAPVLIEKLTVENMKENSVIIDLAAGTGGNCEVTEVEKVVEINGVKIVGETDILNTVKHAATKLYSENVRNLIELYIENSDDEIFVEMSS